MSQKRRFLKQTLRAYEKQRPEDRETLKRIKAGLKKFFGKPEPLTK